MPARLAFGSLLVQQIQGLTDRETAEAISENIYIQYFLGFKEFVQELPFDASMMTIFRRRFGKEALAELNEKVVSKALAEQKSRLSAKDEKSDDEDEGDDTSPPSHSGTLIVGASCVPSDIRPPSDLGLLYDPRRCLEEVIDTLYAHSDGKEMKPMTYREVA